MLLFYRVRSSVSFVVGAFVDAPAASSIAGVLMEVGTGRLSSVSGVVHCYTDRPTR